MCSGRQLVKGVHRMRKDYQCKTLILCGGKGTRLGTLGKSVPKALVDLDGKPILYHKLHQSIRQGYDEFILAIGYKGNLIKEVCGRMKPKCKVVFSDSGENAGMLRRICDAQSYFDRKVLVTYGDSITNIKIRSLIDFHTKKRSLLSIVAAPIQSPFGLVTSDHDHRVMSFEEKPVLHYYIGTFMMDREALDYIPEQIKDWPDGKGLVAFFKSSWPLIDCILTTTRDRISRSTRLRN